MMFRAVFRGSWTKHGAGRSRTVGCLSGPCTWDKGKRASHMVRGDGSDMMGCWVWLKVRKRDSQQGCSIEGQLGEHDASTVRGQVFWP